MRSRVAMVKSYVGNTRGGGQRQKFAALQCQAHQLKDFIWANSEFLNSHFYDDTKRVLMVRNGGRPLRSSRL